MLWSLRLCSSAASFNAVSSRSVIGTMVTILESLPRIVVPYEAHWRWHWSWRRRWSRNRGNYGVLIHYRQRLESLDRLSPLNTTTLNIYCDRLTFPREPINIEWSRRRISYAGLRRGLVLTLSTQGNGDVGSELPITTPFFHSTTVSDCWITNRAIKIGCLFVSSQSLVVIAFLPHGQIECKQLTINARRQHAHDLEPTSNHLSERLENMPPYIGTSFRDIMLYLSTSQPADLRPLGRPAWYFERPAAGWLGLIGLIPN
jgi:hypothetical protein